MMSTDIQFRIADNGDLEGIIEMWMESSEYHRSIDPRLSVRPDARKHISSYYSKFILSERAFCAVATLKGSQIGYICVQILERPPIHYEKESGFVDGLFVKSEHRLRGVGSTLFQMALKWLKDHDITSVRLSVSPYNSDAFAFWKSVGLRELMYIMQLEI